MELAATNVRELNVSAKEIPSTAGPTAADQNPVNLAGDSVPN